MPWINPKLDWIANPVNPTSVDMNRIESNIDFINTDIETKKGSIVDALINVGIPTLITDTHAAIAAKIAAAEKTGVSITPSAINQAIPKGIFNTGGGVVVGDADLVASNIANLKDVFGIIGTFKGIKSIQQGSLYNSGVASVSATINAVNIDNSIILTDWRTFPSTSDHNMLYDCSFASTTSVVLKASVNYSGGYLDFIVIELEPTVIKSLQRGVATVQPGTPVVIALTSVNLSKSIAFCAGGYGRYRGTGSDTQGHIYVSTKTTTSVTLTNPHSSAGLNTHWQVIEFY